MIFHQHFLGSFCWYFFYTPYCNFKIECLKKNLIKKPIKKWCFIAQINFLESPRWPYIILRHNSDQQEDMLELSYQAIKWKYTCWQMLRSSVKNCLVLIGDLIGILFQILSDLLLASPSGGFGKKHKNPRCTFAY